MMLLFIIIIIIIIITLEPGRLKEELESGTKKTIYNFIMVILISCSPSSDNSKIIYSRMLGSEKCLEYFNGWLLWKRQCLRYKVCVGR
jgi:hypothetical protein